MKEKLDKVLDAFQVKDKFYEHLKKQEESRGNKVDFFERNKHDPREWISNAFTWFNTPEGWDFWHSVHQQWSFYCNK